MKNYKLFIVWGVIVIIVIGLLTTLGFMLKKTQSEYDDVEKKLVNSASGYVEYKFLYSTIDKNGSIKITSKELMENGFLTEEDLVKNDDKCVGYVVVSKKNVYNYKSYIKCGEYTTSGYSK